MRIGTQQQLHVSDRLLTEGTKHDAIVCERPQRRVCVRRQGEIVGEMSLLESQPVISGHCSAVARRAMADLADAANKGVLASLPKPLK
jgi:hypothetical protein